MTFFPGIRTFDKLMKNDWRTLLYGERAETWDEKLYSLIRRGWHQIFTFLDSRGRHFINYSGFYAAIFIGSIIVLGTFKYVRYVGTNKFRKNNKSERPIGEKIVSEESRIVSDDGNEETENSVEKPRSTCRSDFDDATSAEDNDHLDIKQESNISSATTIVASEKNEERQFLKNLIDSIEPGDDGVDHVEKNIEETENDKEILELQESTREKVDSKNCKHFYVLTPWIGDNVEPGDTEGSSIPINNSLSPSPMIEEAKKANSTMHKNFFSSGAEQSEINKNLFVPSKLAKPSSPEAATVNSINDERKSTGQTMRETTNSTLAGAHETSSVCYADEVLSPITDHGKNVFSRQYSSPECESSVVTETKSQCNNIERVLGNFPMRLPELDLSPISHNPEKIPEKTINIATSKVRTDSKHRFRSLSHDNRTVSSADYFDTRRGSSVSPPARNKKIQRSMKQMQSKIPTLSPLAHRAMQSHQETDGSLSETANQIRSVLLRKLKEVWEQRSRDTTPSPNRSRNSSFENSIYSTPEGVSRIPLPRRSPRHSNANYLTPSSRLSGHSDRATDQSGQSEGASYSGLTSKCVSPADIAAVPLHSTPKTSPSFRGNNHNHGL